MKFLCLASHPEAYCQPSQAFHLALEALSQSNEILIANASTLAYATLVNLPLPRKKVPFGTPTTAWQKACEPLVNAIDAINDLDGIFVFDEPALRALTASRVPQAPLFWVGALKNKKLPLYTTTALRLTTAILLPSTLDKQTLLERCTWQHIDPRTLPEILPMPTLQPAWHALLPTLPNLAKPTQPASIERALRQNAFPLLGRGSRRVCHQLPNTELCVKFYHPSNALPKKIKLAVRFEVWRSAHHRYRNTSCQEFDYLQKVRHTKPASLIALFPEYIDLLYLPAYGWGLIETRICNADGSPTQRFPEVLNQNTQNPALYTTLVEQLDLLLEDLCSYALPFYDFQNVLVQHQSNGSMRLRIADFEPRTRQILPFDTLPYFAQKKLRRRYHRTFKNSVRPLSPQQ